MALSIQPTIVQPYAESPSFRPGRAPSRAPGAESPAGSSTSESTSQTAVKAQGQTEQEKKVVDELKARDREVRAHEQAHVAAAGGLALGGPTYTYQYGPDGIAYAVGGEVNIDTSPGRTPEETIDKARQIRAAALAPSDPSDQDRAVAAAAAQLEAQARQEISQQQTEERTQATAPAPSAGAGDASNEATESTPASESDSQQTEQARQAVALYGAIAAAANQGSLINVSA